MNYRELFKVDRLLVFQNKLFTDNGRAFGWLRVNVSLVQNMEIGLIFNTMPGSCFSST